MKIDALDTSRSLGWSLLNNVRTLYVNSDLELTTILKLVKELKQLYPEGSSPHPQVLSQDSAAQLERAGEPSSIPASAKPKKPVRNEKDSSSAPIV